MRIEVWMLPDCPRCHDALAVLRAADFEPAAQPIQALRSGEVQDVDAMAHLVMVGRSASSVGGRGRPQDVGCVHPQTPTSGFAHISTVYVDRWREENGTCVAHGRPLVMACED
jgi:hypothetical protein